MKTLTETLTEVTMLNYSKRNERYAKQRIVMTIAAKLKRSYRFECKEMTITLKEIWAAVKQWFASLTNEPIKRTTAVQPNLSSIYNNAPSGAYMGD